MARLIVGCCFHFIPEDPSEMIAGGTPEPLTTYERSLFATLGRTACLLVPIFIWTTINEVFFHLIHKALLGPGETFVSIVATMALFVQALTTRKIGKHSEETTLRQLRELSVLLQVVVLVKTAKLFSNIRSAQLECSLSQLAFASKADALGEFHYVPCHPLFGVEATLSVLCYVIVTLVQAEVVHRIERSWMLKMAKRGLLLDSARSSPDDAGGLPVRDRIAMLKGGYP